MTDGQIFAPEEVDKLEKYYRQSKSCDVLTRITGQVSLRRFINSLSAAKWEALRKHWAEKYPDD